MTALFVALSYQYCIHSFKLLLRLGVQAMDPRVAGVLCSVIDCSERLGVSCSAMLERKDFLLGKTECELCIGLPIPLARSGVANLDSIVLPVASIFFVALSPATDSEMLNH